MYIYIHDDRLASQQKPKKASWVSLLAGELQIIEEEEIALVDRQGVL
jgi:hypothetical protein